jgi:hypothetical protein
MVLVAVFGAAPVIAVLLFGLAARTLLSTSSLILASGQRPAARSSVPGAASPSPTPAWRPDAHDGEADDAGTGTGTGTGTGAVTGAVTGAGRRLWPRT